MNTTQPQQKALDDALVAPADLVMDALALTPFYRAFLITADVPAIYMQEFWATVFVHRSSIRFTINKKKVSLDVDIFRDILQFCLKIPRQVFEDLLLEQYILSFIRDLGYTGDITYLTDVNVDYLHQLWRAFATVINKCLSGKETRMDKIRLSCAQILWGMFHKKNIDHVYLLWEYLLFQIEYKYAKKTNKICISRHKDTQVYVTILPTELTNQEMLESKAYQTYYAFASGEKAPKPKLKSKAKVAKPNKKKQPAKKTKAKGLAVLSEVALTEAEQIKLATKRIKKDFHVSHANGSGDGVDTQSKVPDEQQQKTSGTDKESCIIPRVPDVPLYESESDKESWGDSEDEDDTNDDGDNDDDGESDDHDDDNQTEYEEEDIDDQVRTPSDYELTNEEKLDDEEKIDNEDDEVIKELYDDVNVNLRNDDTEITDADQGATEQQNVSQESGFKQVEEDAHLLNLENPSPADNEIASLLEALAHHATAIPESTSGFTTTTHPPTSFFNPLLQQQTPTFTKTTSTNPTVIPEIPNFASVFKFDQRVSALESKMSELKQTNQFTEVVSLIMGIVDTYLASKMKEVVDVVVQLQTNKLREEAQAENQEFLNQVDSTIKTIIKDQVKAQVSMIMPKIEKYVTESLGAEVLVRSTNQSQTAYAVAASMSEFELKKILIDKMEAKKSINRSNNQKNLYNALVESYNSDKYIITLYGDVVLLKRGRDDQDKDEDPSVGSDR
ncbi:hypothetical protein Tco_1050199, partial [Tanacetum coccineum]